jgi:hypothetical protein
MAMLSAMNVTGSAMVRVDETYNETNERAKRRLKQYEEAQHARARELIEFTS